MGCASSKTDDLPAVILCRDRLNHLSGALHHRFLLSEAHLSYIHSLQSVGLSLHRFFDTAASLPSPPPTPPPPPNPKLAAETNNNSGHLSSSLSDSGSHLHFHSDSDEDHDHGLLHDVPDHGSGSGSGSGHRHLHNELGGPTTRGGFGGGGMMMYEETGFGGGGGGSGYGSGMSFNPYFYSGNNSGYTVNYMKRHVTPSVSYKQRPVSYDTQTVQFGDPSTNDSNYYYDYFGGGNNNGYMGNFSGGGAGHFGPQLGAQGGGGWNSGMPPQQMGPTKQQAPPPPPPPPPATSTWDFMNLFESIEDNHYPAYRNRTPSSRDSREVREEEGIPDLEDEEDTAHEVVKEVHGHQKLVVDEGGGSSGGISSISSGGEGIGGGEAKRGEVVEEEKVGKSEVESGNNVYRGRPSASIESAPVEYEVRMVDKKVVGEEGKGDGSRAGGRRPGFRNVFEVVKEIQVQFERAANSGGELEVVLEVGRLRYQRKSAAFQGLED